MRRLILMRHAKSDWGNTILSDHDRPLNSRGRQSATLLGDWMRRQGFAPDEVLCSTAVRTRETLAGLGLDLPSAPQFQRALYLAEADDMLGALKRASGACVLMIAHNHGIADMAQSIVAHAPDHPRFLDYPTGATLVVDFDVKGWNEIGWHTGQPIAFVVPRELPEA